MKRPLYAKFHLKTQTGGSAVRDLFRVGGKPRPRTPSMPRFDLPPHLEDQPCKNTSRECAPDGSCLRCGAVQGSSCRPARHPGSGPRGGADR